jgi:putative component of membrane protein insertase Oxa1/YidC/SpoIIIJ protein YidD
MSGPSPHSLVPGVHLSHPAAGRRFQPTCSHYATGRERHGVLKGGLTLWRLLRCAPFNPGGMTPYP